MLASLKKTIKELKPSDTGPAEEDHEDEDEEERALRLERERRAKTKPKFKEGNTVIFRYRVLRDGKPTALRVYGQVISGLVVLPFHVRSALFL